MQKELGRYLFSVFLEKRKSKRHSKKNPPKAQQKLLKIRVASSSKNNEGSIPKYEQRVKAYAIALLAADESS